MGYIGNQPYLGTVTGDIVVDGSITAQDLAPGAAVPSQTGNAGKYLTTDGTNASWGALSQVRVTAIDYPGDDTATLPAGGATLTLTGTGFAATPMVFVDGTLAPSVSFVSSTQITFVAPAKSAGTYHLYVVNPDGATAIFVNGISYSGVPTWTTASGSLGTFDATFSIQLVATSDSAVTYALATGSSLPGGVTLSSGGLISGTSNTEQTFSFSVDAIDAENQETARSFSVTIALAEPYFNRNVLLLSGNGANNQTNNTFLDSSGNSFTITRNGNTTQGTFSPFSQTGWGNYFDGSGDYLSVADNAALDIPGDFTIEFWVNVDSGNTDRAGIIGHRDQSTFTDGTDWVIRVETSAGKIGFGYGSSGVYYDMGSYVVGEWAHYAITRSGTTIRTFKNGTQVATATSSSTWSSTAEFLIGRNVSGFDYKGFLSNLRLVKGTAVYTSAFTPPTTPLAAISGTSLLTCQSNRFIDNSTNAFAITRNGNTSIQAFSPFNPTAAWSAATNGGSGYFDGSGDYLSVADNVALDAFSGDFTIEFWIYPNSLSGAILAKGWGGGATVAPYLFLVSGSSILLYSSSDGGSWNVSLGTAVATNVPTNSWTHIAISRSGSSLRLFQNGAVTNTISTSATLMNSSEELAIGAASGGYSPMGAGYISGVRIVKGTAVYTAAFTPPTAPLTAVTNTSLLTNFTNAGIYDATSKNDLETVGNAQISTTQSKFGGSSMYFDGTNDGLIGPSTQLASFGTGDFTVESWVYLTTISGADRYLFTTGNGIDTSLRLYIGSTGEVVVYTSFGIRLSSTNPLVVNTWTHVAVRRYNGTLAVYLNGVQNGTASYSTAIDCNGKISVGSDNNGGSSMIGYLDDFRVTKGIARYTSNFTPPTTAHKLR